MSQANKFKVIGLMSGTSLDGLDVTYVEFSKNTTNDWEFSVLASGFYSYDKSLQDDLKQANTFSVPQILMLDKKLGQIYADFVLDFISRNKLVKSDIDLISSHGQTIFHQPKNGFTYQIGCGTTLSFLTGIPVLNDFRSKDVIAGGQGAPLVPKGDFELFKEKAQSFLNIGGFANISFQKDGLIHAFDVCPGNLPLNKLVSSKGLEYDKNGELSKSGEINFFLLEILNELEYYQLNGPKSLGTEWLESKFYPLVKFDKEIENNLRTVTEHIAIQIANVLEHEKLNSVFITGGGAKNQFLIDRIKNYYKGEVIIPESEIIDYKESIIFAFLGALYLNKEANCISSVTGANRDVMGGVLHTP